MNFRKKKRIAILLYAAYAIFVTLLLIFGAKVSSWAINIVDTTLNKKDIIDVTVNVEEGQELLAKKDQYIRYTAHGDFTGDPGLQFTSLDPEHVVVTKTGTVYSNMNFEGDYLDAQIKVTSKYDEDFEKVFTFRFVKKLPDEFIATYYVKGYAHSVKNLKVGVPVYVFSHTEQKSGYNVSDYSIEYDEEYFRLAADGALIPIKLTPEGVKLGFKVVYYNGRSAETSSFTISEPAEEVTEIDEIRFDGKSTDEFVGTRNKGAIVTLYNDGKQVMTDYTVEVENAGDVAFSKASHMSFYSAGDKLVTFTLPNGFSKTVTVKIRNVIELPTVVDIADDVEVIDMQYSEVRTFNLKFSGSVTYDKVKYEFDSNRLSVTAGERSFTVSPKRSGETTLKITVDDGFDSVTRTFTFNVEKSPNIIATITKNVAKFVAKVMGHIALFAFLAILTMNMFKYSGIYRAPVRFMLYCLCALPVAAITEYAQTFIPGRSGRVQDVLIDMAGFFVGTAAVLIYRWIMDSIRLRNRRNRKKGQKALSTLRAVDSRNIENNNLQKEA